MTTDDYRWLPMTTDDYQWLPMTINDYQWQPMTTNDYQWLSMTTDDYQWLPMTTDDYWWLPMTTNDYQWLLMTTNVSQKDYLKRSRDLRWLFNLVLSFILRWSWFLNVNQYLKFQIELFRSAALFGLLDGDPAANLLAEFICIIPTLQRQ